MPPETNTANKNTNCEVIPELIEEARHRLDGVNQSIRVIEYKTYLLVLANFAILGILWEAESHTLFSLIILVPVVGAFICFFQGLFDMHIGGIPGTEPKIWLEGQTNEEYREEISAYLFMDYQDAIKLSTKKHEVKKKWYLKGYRFSQIVFGFVCLEIFFGVVTEYMCHLSLILVEHICGFR